jgi:hypothetical protein
MRDFFYGLDCANSIAKLYQQRHGNSRSVPRSVRLERALCESRDANLLLDSAEASLEANGLLLFFVL